MQYARLHKALSLYAPMTHTACLEGNSLIARTSALSAENSLIVIQ